MGKDHRLADPTILNKNCLKVLSLRDPIRANGPLRQFLFYYDTLAFLFGGSKQRAITSERRDKGDRR